MQMQNGKDDGLGGWANPNNVQDGDTAHPDDLIGWNFVNNTNNPYDDEDHGTHTAGTIGMMANDGVGVAGVDWNVSIMALKFLDASGSGTDVGAAEAIDYAALHGAKVSNNSYGGGDGGTTMENAIKTAQAAGDIFVAAAGNSGQNTDSNGNYPSAYPEPNIIAVAATDSSGNLAGFSNYGAQTVDLAAPGVNVYSTLPNDNFAEWSGTSMATPHVAGTVALLQAEHPTWTYSQVINQIFSTVTPDGQLAGKSVTGGILNAGAAIDQSANLATFVGTDATTQGAWSTTYGADGYDLAQGAVSLPSYAQVTLSGQNNCLWQTGTTDPATLQTGPGSSTRFAACWYTNAGSGSSFTIDVNLTDQKSHQVSLYALDWLDGNLGGRSERIDVIDPTSNTVLSTQTIAGFGAGEYLTWSLTGHVQIRVTNLSTNPGNNAVIGGLFFGTPSATKASASFTASDTKTQGAWSPTYGADGYDLAQGAVSLPSYAQVTLSGQNSYTWQTGTTDPATLQTGPGSSTRFAACWYTNAGSGSSFTINVDLTDGQAHRVSLYALDWLDGNLGGRSERIDVIDPTSNTVLSTQTIAGFSAGEYLSWEVAGYVQIRVTNLSTNPGNNAVISGLFFGTAPASASFINSDTTTQGSWSPTYGADGYDLAEGNISLPSYAQVSLNGESGYTWQNGTTDPATLQTGPSVSTRFAACWYTNAGSGSSFTIDVNLTDGLIHQVSLYALDWMDGNLGGRSERIDVIDPTSSTVLSTQTIAGFGAGEYLTWALTGHVQIRVTNLSTNPSNNAVISGLFFSTPSATKASATFVSSDTTTQGAWSPTYGANGYDLAQGAVSLPSYAQASLSGESSYTWQTGTTDPATLQTGPGSSTRFAACWYTNAGSGSSFTIDVNLTDQKSHQVSLYALDWLDGNLGGRSERIDVIDPTSNTVLSTQTIAGFGSGEYLTWSLTGHVQIRVTNLSTNPGNNAVISGLFFN